MKKEKEEKKLTVRENIQAYLDEYEDIVKGLQKILNTLPDALLDQDCDSMCRALTVHPSRQVLASLSQILGGDDTVQ